MKKLTLYEQYPKNPKANGLSMAGGAARLLSILLLAGAVLVGLFVIGAGVRLASRVGGGMAMLYVLDELDDGIEALLFLAGGGILCAFGARCLGSLARSLAGD